VYPGTVGQFQRLSQPPSRGATRRRFRLRRSGAMPRCRGDGFGGRKSPPDAAAPPPGWVTGCCSPRQTCAEPRRGRTVPDPARRARRVSDPLDAAARQRLIGGGYPIWVADRVVFPMTGSADGGKVGNWAATTTTEPSSTPPPGPGPPYRISATAAAASKGSDPPHDRYRAEERATVTRAECRS
jgi:hypothetical protein